MSRNFLLSRRALAVGLVGAAAGGLGYLLLPGVSPDDEVIHSAVRSPISLRRVAQMSFGRDVLRHIVWAPNGQYLAGIVGNNMKVAVIDASAWAEICRFNRASETGKPKLAFLSDSEIVTVTDDNEIANSPWALGVYDSKTGRLLRRMARPREFATASTVAVTVTSSRNYVVALVGSPTTAILIFDPVSGDFIDRLPTPRDSWTRVLASGPANKLAVEIMISKSELSRRKEIQIFDVGANTVGRILSGHVPYADAMAWSPDGRLIASAARGFVGDGDGKWVRDLDPIRIWDIATGDMVISFAGYFDGVSSLAWHPSGKFVASIGRKDQGEYGDALRFWSPADKAMTFELRAPGTGLFTALSFHPRTGHLLLGWDDKLYVFEVLGLS